MKFVSRVLLKRILSLPAFSNPEHAQTARWLTLSLLVLAVVIVVMGFIVPLIANPSLLQFAFVLANLASLAVILGALLMVRLGYVKLAATLSVLLLFAVVTYANISLFGNIRSPNLLAYFVLIPLAGLVLGKRAMLRFSILCIIAIGLVFALEITDVLPPVPHLHSTWSDLFIWFLALAFNTILLTAMIQRSEASAETTYQALTALQKSQAQLQQALEKEKELGELKSRFVSMASHEFRTPLTVILSMSESLIAYRNKLTEPQIDERLGKVLEQVLYMRNIMEDMLQLARQQERRMEFNPAWLDLDAFCRSILDEFQNHPQVAQRFRYTCDNTLSQMYVDQQLIRQIFSNLVSNAIKYSPVDKKIMIQLRETGQGVELAVCDEGIGIPTADLPYLFEPFHRGGNVDVIAGTGLGMAIVKQAVERHGGTITVESQVDIGTTVRVGLPVATDLGEEYEKNSDH